MLSRFLTVMVMYCSLSNVLYGQSPGLIVRPAGGIGVTVLNPDGNAYASLTTAGFTTNDITQSEIPFVPIPVAIQENAGDIATGPVSGFTDIVHGPDGNAGYIFKNATNIFFRLRLGSIVSGSKGYSFLIDTDGKMGNSGPNADPDYVPASGSGTGNPGFEYEVVLQTNSQVAVYNINGTATPPAPTVFSLNTNSQIAVALTTDNNNPDYFYDWFVPVSAIGNPTSIRVAVTTVTSPNSALQGNRSDIYGINDQQYSSTAAGWEKVVNAQPQIPITTFSGVGPVCTAPPVLNSPINAGVGVSVTGTWTRLDASKPSSATITLYRNNIVDGTTTVSSGGSWSISSTVNPGDEFYAKAQAAGESQCLSSSIVKAACAAVPASPAITCASTKGITGTIPLGSTVRIYSVTTANAVPVTTLLTTGLVYSNNVSDRTFNYYSTNPQSGNACQGQSNLLTTGTYMFITDNSGCLSAPTFICITGASSNAWALLGSNALTITTPVYPYQTTVSGTGATSGHLLRLFVNDSYVTSVTATGSAFSFTGLTLASGDRLRVYDQVSGSCMTVSAQFTVSCYTGAPVISTNTGGNLLPGTTVVNGVSAYPGASVQLYKGNPPAGVATGAAATVSANGGWSVTIPATVSGENYYAIQTVSACASPASTVAAVLTPSACPVITGSYTSASTNVTGTMPAAFTGTIRLYLDGDLIGSQAITATNAWSIAVPANTLYYNGVLSVTAQAAGAAQSSGCATATVGCTPPLTPVINPVNTTINTGQTVTYNISNTATNTWYALQDNSGLSYATSQYHSVAGNFSMQSSPFNAQGNYSLKLTADALSGCPASFAAASVTVNLAAVPVRFISVRAAGMSDDVVLSWEVTNEVNVKEYIIERSSNGIDFVTAGNSRFNDNGAGVNRYVFTDAGAAAQQRLFYRIKQVDHDLQTIYSTVVVYTGNAEWKVTVNPHPVIGNINIMINAMEPDEVQIVLYTAHGSTIYMDKKTIYRGTNNFIIPADRLAEGNYLLRVNGKKARHSQVLISRKP